MIGNVYSCFHYLQKCIKSAFSAENAANRAEEYANSLEPETFVKKSGNQTIGGDLTIDKDGFQTIFFQSPDIDYTSVEQTNIKGGRILELDKNGQYYGYFQSQVDANGAYSTAISTRRSVGGANKSSTISTVVDKNGNIYTSAPTPATSDNSTKIATTAWVRTCTGGYTHSYGISSTANPWQAWHEVKDKDGKRVLLEQWFSARGTTPATWTFAKPFTTYVFSGIGVLMRGGQAYHRGISGVSLTSMTWLTGDSYSNSQGYVCGI